MNAETSSSSGPTPPQQNTESKPDTDSVMPAIYDWPDFSNMPGNDAKAACPKEKKVTLQYDIVIAPVDIEGSADVVETMKLARRVVLCTSCGNLRLIS